MAALIKQQPAMVFEHTQAVASATWVIVHGLAMYPIVDVFVQYNGEDHKILPGSVQYDSANQITISFSVPLAGKASLS